MLRIFVALAALLAATATPARADEIADFYRGKTVRLVIGYGAGGGYDVYAKLLARFLGEQIPGKPTVIAQNMPGAGSRNAANWLYKVAPKDGTVLAVLGQATPIDQALGQAGIQFDARQFNWIGNMVVVNNIMIVWAATGVRSIDDAKKRPLAIGATGASSPSVLYPTLANNLFGTQFRIVSGYPGGGDIMLALERREVDGRGSDSWASLKANNPSWISEGKVNILFQIGPRREADLPGPPLLTELAQNAEQRQILEVLSGDVAVGRPVLTAPDVPAARVRALRKAFDDTMKDPAFREAAAKANMYMNPLGGEELQQIVNRILSPPPEIIDKVKDAIRPRNLQVLPGVKLEGAPKE
ncbi:tripartite tricarboxylate transporter substrate-binding protein [Bradyrhizobium sp.]|uniref:Bug family tripartite tricarboxylate transporter substrate binding protein n=1 Tax=Bradyrhizobium sp. TaxID=376 RepID=UPI0025BA2409|nr:tripartite tricarboxylate transporter substrate-binding protein [Bradyrhizobium sp.]